jgi:hypothetical protein
MVNGHSAPLPALVEHRVVAATFFPRPTRTNDSGDFHLDAGEASSRMRSFFVPSLGLRCLPRARLNGRAQHAASRLVRPERLRALRPGKPREWHQALSAATVAKCRQSVQAGLLTTVSRPGSVSVSYGAEAEMSALAPNWCGPGATLQRPGWAGSHIGFQPFPSQSES